MSRKVPAIRYASLNFKPLFGIGSVIKHHSSCLIHFIRSIYWITMLVSCGPSSDGRGNIYFTFCTNCLKVESHPESSSFFLGLAQEHCGCACYCSWAVSAAKSWLGLWSWARDNWEWGNLRGTRKLSNYMVRVWFLEIDFKFEEEREMIS